MPTGPLHLSSLRASADPFVPQPLVTQEPANAWVPGQAPHGSVQQTAMPSPQYFKPGFFLEQNPETVSTLAQQWDNLRTPPPLVGPSLIPPPLPPHTVLAPMECSHSKAAEPQPQPVSSETATSGVQSQIQPAAQPPQAEPSAPVQQPVNQPATKQRRHWDDMLVEEEQQNGASSVVPQFPDDTALLSTLQSEPSDAVPQQPLEQPQDQSSAITSAEQTNDHPQQPLEPPGDAAQPLEPPGDAAQQEGPAAESEVPEDPQTGA